jgi:type II secretory pathway component PulF
VGSKDIVAFTSQLGTALRAGLPMMACLELIRNQQKHPAARMLFENLVQAVNTGQSLSEAMTRHPQVFGPLYISMIRVGETGGILDQTTGQLSRILQRDDKIKTSMKNAAAYPLFVLCLGLVSVILIVTWVIPKMLRTLDMDISVMPWPTRILMAASHVVTNLVSTIYGWAVILLVVWGLWRLARWIRHEGRLAWDRFKLNVPLLGTVLRTIAVGRFARTLGALTEGGVTILEALAVVRDTLGNELLGREIDKVSECVKRGEPLAEPLDSSGLFPPLLVQVVAVGEQTGKLDELLLNAAETFDAEADAVIERFMRIFPALLILILAVIIGFIIVAALLPMATVQLGAV